MEGCKKWADDDVAEVGARMGGRGMDGLALKVEG